MYHRGGQAGILLDHLKNVADRDIWAGAQRQQILGNLRHGRQFGDGFNMFVQKGGGIALGEAGQMIGVSLC